MPPFASLEKSLDVHVVGSSCAHACTHVYVYAYIGDMPFETRDEYIG